VLVKVLVVLNLASLSEGLEPLAAGVPLKVFLETLLSVELLGLDLFEGELCSSHDLVESLSIVNP